MIDKFSSSKEKKAEILRLASSGASRPPRRNHPLGNVLAKYISESAFSFDADFKNKLQELRPDWFKFKEKRNLEIEKAALLKLAASGAEKPLPKKHPLGHKLKSYISHGSKVFDPEFKDKLQEIRPDWFQRNHDPESKKAALLELAASGEKKPVRLKHPLGSALEKYIKPSSQTWDPEFRNKLQELRPDWFSQQKDSKEKKIALLELAASGAAKPLPRKHPLGHSLAGYVSHSSKCFDPEFKDKLQKIRPDWFQRNHDPESKKAALLEFATSGAEKPLLKKHPLGHNLKSYISHGSKVFDPEFKDKLQEMRPDWFQRNHDPELKKAALLELATSGAEKPLPRKHQLGYDLKNYISRSSKCFDPEFKNKLQELRPDWF